MSRLYVEKLSPFTYTTPGGKVVRGMQITGAADRERVDYYVIMAEKEMITLATKLLVNTAANQ